MNRYELSILKELVNTYVVGFNQIVPESKDDHNRALFAFDTNSFSFEYCNPGELALTFLMEDKRLICLTFKGENIQLQEDADYPKFVINQMDYNSDSYYNYLINLKIIEIEVFSSTIDNSIVDELIIFNCENGKKFY